MWLRQPHQQLMCQMGFKQFDRRELVEKKRNILYYLFEITKPHICQDWVDIQLLFRDQIARWRYLRRKKAFGPKDAALVFSSLHLNLKGIFSMLTFFCAIKKII